MRLIISRINLNEKFQHLVKTETKILDAQEKTTLSLVEATREAEYKENKENQLELENEFRVLHGLEPLPQTDSDIEG